MAIALRILGCLALIVLALVVAPQHLQASDWKITDIDWSPDGRKLAVAQSLRGRYQLTILSRDGSQRRVTAGAGWLQDLHWSGGSDWLLFGRYQQGKASLQAVCMARLDSAQVRVLVGGCGYPKVDSSETRGLGLSEGALVCFRLPDGRVLWKTDKGFHWLDHWSPAWAIEGDRVASYYRPSPAAGTGLSLTTQDGETSLLHGGDDAHLGGGYGWAPGRRVRALVEHGEALLAQFQSGQQDPRTLANLGAHAAGPAVFNRDGTWCAVLIGSDDSGSRRLVLVDLEKGGTRHVRVSTSAYYTPMRWSRDGMELAIALGNTVKVVARNGAVSPFVHVN